MEIKDSCLERIPRKGNCDGELRKERVDEDANPPFYKRYKREEPPTGANPSSQGALSFSSPRIPHTFFLLPATPDSSPGGSGPARVRNRKVDLEEGGKPARSRSSFTTPEKLRLFTPRTPPAPWAERPAAEPRLLAPKRVRQQLEPHQQGVCIHSCSTCFWRVRGSGQGPCTSAANQRSPESSSSQPDPSFLTSGTHQSCPEPTAGTANCPPQPRPGRGPVARAPPARYSTCRPTRTHDDDATCFTRGTLALRAQSSPFQPATGILTLGHHPHPIPLEQKDPTQHLARPVLLRNTINSLYRLRLTISRLFRPSCPVLSPVHSTRLNSLSALPLPSFSRIPRSLPHSPLTKHYCRFPSRLAAVFLRARDALKSSPPLANLSFRTRMEPHRTQNKPQ